MPTITHAFVSLIADDQKAVAAGEVVPSNWNANHSLVYNIETSTTGSSATMSSTEDVREVNISSSFTVNLPTSPIKGKPYTVVDTSGNAFSNNITVNPVGYVIGSDNGGWTGYNNGTSWVQIG